MTTNSFGIDAFFEEREAEREKVRLKNPRSDTGGKGQSIQAAVEDKPWLDLDDAAMFIPRAAEGFARSIGSLMPGLDLSDKRVFGRSDTIVGGALESITQFGLGFVPALGVVGKFGALAKAGKLGTTLASASKISQTVGAVKGGRFLLGAVEGAQASAIADFVAFDGHEANLSAVLNQIPALAPLVPDFLATNADEGQVINRMRNVLEGLGMGAVLGTLIEGLRGTKALRTAVDRVKGRSLTRAEEKEAIASSVDPGRMSEGLKDVQATRYGPDPQKLQAIEDDKLLQPDVPGAEAPGAPDVTGQGFKLDGDMKLVHKGSQTPLHRETSLDDSLSFMPGENGNIGGPFGAPELHFAEDETLALGQKGNQGVVLSFDPGVEDLKPAKDKPISIGEHKGQVNPKKMQDLLNKVVIKKDNTGPKVTRVDRNLTNRGWEKEVLENGDTVYKRPEVDPAAAGAKPGDPDEAFVPAGTPQTLKTSGPDISEPLRPGRPRNEALSNDPAHLEAFLREFTKDDEGGNALFEAMMKREAMGDLSKNPRKLSGIELIAQAVTSEHNNLDKLLSDSNKGAEWVLRAFEDVGLLDKPPKMSAEEWVNSILRQEVALSEGVPASQMDEHLIARTDKAAATIAEINAHARFVALLNIAQLDALTRKLVLLRDKGGSTRELAELAVNDTRLTRALLGVSSGSGELLESTKHWSDDSNVAQRFFDRMEKAREEGSTVLDDFIEDWSEATAGDVTTEKWLKQKELSSMTFSRQVLVMTHQLFVNNILGGFKTLIIQPLSGTMLSMSLPMEQMIGGALLKDMPTVTRSMKELIYMSSSVSDAATWALNTAKTGKSSISGEGLGNAVDTNAWQAGMLGTKAGSPGGIALDFMGTIVGAPSRLINTADDFTKQLRARSVLKADAFMDATLEDIPQLIPNPDFGKVVGAPETLTVMRKRNQDEISTFVQDRLKKAFVDGQLMSEISAQKRAASEAMESGLTDPKQIEDYVSTRWEQLFDPANAATVERAEMAAKEATLQTEFAKGSTSAAIQQVLNSNIMLKFVVPFFKTPTNVLKSAAQRLDVPHVAQWMASTVFDPKHVGLKDSQNRFIQDMLSEDPIRKAQAVGRIATGASLVTFGGMMAANGTITGRGPSNKAERDALVDSGWQPYSMKTADGYVSYQKLDPYATFFGTMADFSDSARLAGEDDNVEFSEAMFAIMTGVANNFTQKSFLMGLGQWIEAMADPTNKLEPFMANYAGAIMPSNLAQMTSLLGDDAMKDSNGMLEKLISRTPGMSDTTTPRRNMLGEVVERSKAYGEDGAGAFYGLFVPIAYREVSSDHIRQELANLKHGFASPRASVQGVDLRSYVSRSGQHAHDRWAQLHGEVTLRGKTLRQTLSNLIRSPRYLKLTSESTALDDSPRVQLIRSELSRFRALAYERMLGEYPEAARDIEERENITQRRKRGLSAL